MNSIELLNLVIAQVKNLRVPAGNMELIKQIWVILGNLEALEDAVEQTSREEEKTDVQSGGDDDHPVEG